MLSFAVIAILLALAQAYTDPECSSYDHSDYGCTGECISTSSCPGGHYISNLCPSQAVNIRCCFTADSDDECVNYDHSTYGKTGHCIESSDCPFNNYISNLCPTKAASIKCCFSKSEESCSSGGTDRQSLACKILNHPKVDLLNDNKYLNPAGSGDGASAYDNIRDTCNGEKAKRSSYTCSSGSTPGGSVYLSTSVLNYVLAVLDDASDNNYMVQVNCFAGACHSTNSWHYQGTAVDFQVLSGSPYGTWMNICSARGARENLGPGDAGHSSHTHCAFSS